MNDEKIETLEKRGFFAMIPSWVLSDKTLSPTCKLVFGEIFSLADDRGQCYPSNRHLADTLGISERQVSRCISELKTASLLDYKILEFNRRSIQVTISTYDKYDVPLRQIRRTPTSDLSTKKTISKHLDKKESIKEKIEDYFLDVPEADVSELADKFNISPSTVTNTAEKIHDYILSTGRHYLDAKATLSGWLRRDLEKTQRKEIPVFADLYGDNPPELDQS